MSATSPIVLKEDPYVVARTVVSADAATIAGKTDSAYEIYRLSPIPRTTTCEGNLFNLTIQPDNFPEDIVWYLSNEVGKKEFGSHLLANEESHKQKPEQLYFIKCLSHENAFFTFILEDLYGDGICCDWGDGSFTLDWNQETVLKSDDFKNYAAICLPQTSDLSLFTAIANFTLTAATEIRFSLVNSSSTFNLLESTLSHTSSLNIDQFQRCIPSTTECLEFVVSDKSGSGVAFDIQMNNTFVQHQAKNFYVNKVSFGSNCGVEYCPKDHQMFEFNFFSDRHPEEFGWELVNSKNATLAKGSGYINKDSHYFYRDCLLVQASECVILRLMDSYNDGGTSYLVSWNRVPVHEGIMTNSSFYEIVVNGVSCQ